MKSFQAHARQSINMYYWFLKLVMISFSKWCLNSRDGICLVPVSGVTGIAMWSHGGDIYLANKSGSVKEPVVINLILGGNLSVPK